MSFSRRDSLGLAALSVLSTLAACGSQQTSHPAAPRPTSHPQLASHPAATKKPAVASDLKPLPDSPLTALPASTQRRIALTVDDGVNPEDVKAYATLCRATGMRMTFFANGRYDSWREAKPILAPLVESGQVVIGNHTWSHPDLRLCSKAQIRWQLEHNDQHFHQLYGIRTLAPFIRPPYGYHNVRVDQAVRSMGYRGMVMWMGTLGDDQNITTRAIENNARTWIQSGRIVIGHANHPGTAKAVDAVHSIIESRHLQTVTVKDVWQS